MSRIEELFKIAESRGVDLQWAPDYAEPGYTCEKGVVLGDWNSVTRKRRVWPLDWPTYLEKPADYDRLEKYVDDTAPRIGTLLEKCGVSLEWEDEWITCSDCGKVFRCHPDCHSWQMSGVILEEVCLCGDCILTDPESVLEHYIGNADKAITFDIDLEDLGYAQHNEESYESGFYPGQRDNTHEIAEQLRKQGITDFVFKIDVCGQFEMFFSVWVKQNESEDEQ